MVDSALYKSNRTLSCHSKVNMQVLYLKEVLTVYMAYHLRDKFSGKKGTISNLNGFIYRDLDTGFSSKWSGYWKPPYKYIDYIAAKVNGVWLDGNTLAGVDYRNKELVYYHELESLTVKEIIKTPEELPGFKMELDIENKTEDAKAVLTKIEPGIDIRRRNQDIGSQDYSIETSENHILISNSTSKAVINSEDRFNLKGDSYIKKHYPGEKQKAFIPGQLSFREEIDGLKSESFQISLKTGEASFNDIESPEARISDHEIARLFNSSVSSMRKLVYYEEGLGIIAGHPWFQNFWGRDMFWTLLGFIDAGYFETSHEILENYAEQEGFPTRIKEDASSDRQGADEPALFVIAADKLRDYWDISEKIEDKMTKAVETIELDSQGVVEHGKDGTWMDTLEREKAVEIQSLNLEAARIIGSDKAEELERGLKEFEGEEYIKDTLEGEEKTINPAIPLMFGHFDGKTSENALEVINAEFSSLYGARTRSMTNPGYHSDGYHTGSVWGLTTGWAAAANLANGKPGQGVNFLKKMTKYLDRNQLGGLPEVVDAESGAILGCGEQAWSAGITVHAIDSYLLGMDVENQILRIDTPGEVSCVRERKRVGNEYITVKFDEGEIEILENTGAEVEIVDQ